MCLYPVMIQNPKYKKTKKNGGVIPPIKDPRVAYVPIGCQTCIECRRQKAREWQTRIMEDIKTNKNAKFITLTFSDKAIKDLQQITETKYLRKGKAKKSKKDNSELDPSKDYKQLKGYERDNETATTAVRLFLERWRKKYKKSLRHWLVTELGHNGTENIHLHGLVWTDNIQDVREIWGYGFVWIGNEIRGKGGAIEYQNYVTAQTVNYIIKYITKIDDKHLNYRSIVLTSPGIGSNYINNSDIRHNKFNGKQTKETYKTEQGNKIALPIYWRNKVYTEEEREKLWLQKLDKQERWVCGEKIDVSKGEEHYYNVLEYHRQRTIGLGYPTPDMIWSKKAYEEQRRVIKQETRVRKGGYQAEE